MKRVTIKDVAERAGVSFGTVSRALSDHPEISLATKERIREIAKEMGYVSNAAARSLVKKSTQTIGLVVTDISNPYFAEIALAVEQEAEENGYQVLLCNTQRQPEREVEALDMLVRRQIDGVILSLSGVENNERCSRLLGSTPAVYLGDNHDAHSSYVTVNNYRIGYIGGRYLSQLGHRQVTLFGAREHSITSQNRVRGFLDAVHEFGTEGTIYYCPPELRDNARGYELAWRFLAEGHRPDAVLAYSDQLALGFLQAAHEFGLRIPHDLSLVGTDNISYSALPRINLTTLSPHKRTIGRTAVSRLLQMIGGDLRENHDSIEPELIIRGSCRNAPRP